MYFLILPFLPPSDTVCLPRAGFHGLPTPCLLLESYMSSRARFVREIQARRDPKGTLVIENDNAMNLARHVAYRVVAFNGKHRERVFESNRAILGSGGKTLKRVYRRRHVIVPLKIPSV